MAKALFTLAVTITEGRATDEFAAHDHGISRTLEIRADQTLNQLHRAIFDAFDRWDDCHLHEFQFGERPRDRGAARYVLPFIYDDPEDFGGPPATGSVTTTRLGKLDLQVGSVFWYWYDFGDNWWHRIEVLAIGESEPKVDYPRVVARVGASPPQYAAEEGSDWDEDENEEDESSAPGNGAGRIPGAVAATRGVETGVMELPDGSAVEWRHEVLSPEATAQVVTRAADRTYRVTTLREFADGTAVVGTYLVPGGWLDACVREIGESECETVLSFEVAER